MVIGASNASNAAAAGVDGLSNAEGEDSDATAAKEADIVMVFVIEDTAGNAKAAFTRLETEATAWRPLTGSACAWAVLSSSPLLKPLAPLLPSSPIPP